MGNAARTLRRIGGAARGRPEHHLRAERRLHNSVRTLKGIDWEHGGITAVMPCINQFAFEDTYVEECVPSPDPYEGVFENGINPLYDFYSQHQESYEEADSVLDYFYRSDDLPDPNLDLTEKFEEAGISGEVRDQVESLIGFFIECAKAGKPLPTVEACFKAAAQASPAAEASAAPARVVLTPSEPKKLWSDRSVRVAGENPADFIKRVYKSELKTLTRSAIRGADPALYQAYATWIRRNPDSDLGLPKNPTVARGPRLSEAKLQELASNSVKHMIWMPAPNSEEPERQARRAAEALRKRRERIRQKERSSAVGCAGSRSQHP